MAIWAALGLWIGPLNFVFAFFLPLLYDVADAPLPPYLAFFGGRRFVPIITAGVSVLIAVVGALIYPAFDWLINEQIGAFVTGVVLPVDGGYLIT